MPNCALCGAEWDGEDLSLFTVPKDDIRRQRWIEICGINFKSSSRVCQNHFDPGDFINGPPGNNNKKCRLMPGAVPRHHIERKKKFYINQKKNTKIYGSNPLINDLVESLVIEPKANNTHKDETEILMQDFQFKECHTRKCGEIVLDTYNSTFMLNCSLCTTICLDLVEFSGHVRKQHKSLLKQYTLIDNKLGNAAEDNKNEILNLEIDSETLSVEIDYETLNMETNNEDNENLNDDSIDTKNMEIEDNENLNDDSIDTKNMEIEPEKSANEDVNEESDIDSAVEYDLGTDNSEVDFQNHNLIAHLIKLIQRKPCIWNTAHPPKKRKIALASLIDPLSKKFPHLNITYENIFIVLRTIRAAYRGELKQMENAEKSNIQYVPQLWCFDQIRILDKLSADLDGVKQKIDDLQKIAVEFPLDIFVKDAVDCEMVTLEIIEHYKEQPHLWNIHHPKTSEEFLEIEFGKFYDCLRQKYSEIGNLTQKQFAIAIDRMLNWYTAIKDIQIHMEKLQKPFNDVYYPRIFNALEFLNGHVPPFCCHICDKNFYLKKIFLNHMSHCGHVINECEHCLMRFSKAANLRAHIINIHSDERAYVCDLCGKAFKRKQSLFLHNSRHEPKPYKCNTCQRTYRTLYFLRNHQNSHLGIRDKVCHICGKAYTSSKYLYQHRLNHFKDYNKTCSNCNKEFKSSSFYTHKKSCMKQSLNKSLNKKSKKSQTKSHPRKKVDNSKDST